jgi:hypothetical protein
LEIDEQIIIRVERSRRSEATKSSEFPASPHLRQVTATAPVAFLGNVAKPGTLRVALNQHGVFKLRQLPFFTKIQCDPLDKAL